MNKEIKKKWIAALTSGEYRQGTLKLRNGDNYCCLGVLCDLHRKSAGLNYKWITEKCGQYYNELYLGSNINLPSEVVIWAGLERSNPKLGKISCSSLNDGDYDFKIFSHTFEQIAKLIEKHL